MFKTIKIALAASILATGFTSIAPVAAQAQNIELAEGLGFGSSRRSATSNAVRAWIRQARRDYPSSRANFNTAFRSGVNCEIEQQTASNNEYTTQGIGVEGNVNGAWSCYVRGIPSDIFN